MSSPVQERATLARIRRIPFSVQILVALVIGVALGLVARGMGPVGDDSPNWLTSTLQTMGGTFVTLLKVLVPPLIVTAVIVSIANLKQVSNAARLAGQTLLWFAITALIAVSIGIETVRGVAHVTEPIKVRVGLIGIGLERAVVVDVQIAVTIDIESILVVAYIAKTVAVAVGLV